MLPFLHDRLRTLNRVLDQSNDVLAKYNRRDLDVGGALTELLDVSIAAYHGLNRATVENRLLALKAECVAASAGTNPLTLERVTTFRRTMQRATALRVLELSAEQLRGDIDADARQLADASALLRPIVLAGIQRGVIPLPWPGGDDQGALDRLWRELLTESDIQLAARQLAMQVSIYDIQLLLTDLLDAAAA